jgi:hypothetical protein
MARALASVVVRDHYTRNKTRGKGRLPRSAAPANGPNADQRPRNCISAGATFKDKIGPVETPKATRNWLNSKSAPSRRRHIWNEADNQAVIKIQEDRGRSIQAWYADILPKIKADKERKT